MIIGYTTGVFDMFHIGHLNILRKAKEQCDFLIVGVSTDELVLMEKHKTPVIAFSERAEIVKAIRYVDQVIPQVDKNKISAWENLHFDKMFVGSDWHGTEQWKKFEEDFAPRGVEIVYLPHTDGISSSQLTAFIKKELDKANTIRGGYKNIGYTTGVFDMFHIGHLNILRKAKEQCDFLIAGVSTDELVMDYKHKKPVIPFEERIEIVRAIRYVDKTIPQTSLDKIAAWENLRFSVMFHGTDWKGSALYEKTEDDLKRVGVRVVWIPHTKGISSTELAKKVSENNNT